MKSASLEVGQLFLSFCIYALDASRAKAVAAAGDLVRLAQDHQTNRTLTLNRFGRALDKLTVVAHAVRLSGGSRRSNRRLFSVAVVVSFVSAAVSSRGTHSCSHSFQGVPLCGERVSCTHAQNALFSIRRGLR